MFGNKFLDDNFLFYLPNTGLKLKILEDRGMRVPVDKEKKKSSLVNIDKKGIYYRPLKSIKRKPDNQDLKYGAVNQFYYKNGFCNKEKVENLKNNSLVAFGDSFTYCTFINPEDAWVKKINLKKFDYEKINFGVTGTDLKYQILLMEQLLKKKHKIIVSTIYEGNDLRNIKNSNYLNKKPSPKLIKKENSFYKNNIKKILGGSYLFNYSAGVRNFYLNYKKNTYNLDFRYRDNIRGINYNINNIDQDELKTAKKIFNNKIKYHEIYDFYSSDMLKIKEIAKNNNSDLLFLYIPSAHNVIPKVNFNNQDTKKYLKKMQNVQRKIFKNICNKNKLNCIDITNKMLNTNIKSLKITHFPSNLHLTKFGHSIIAETLSVYIDQNITR